MSTMIAAAVQRSLDRLHDLDDRTHAVQWFDDERAIADARQVDDGPTDPAARPLRGVPITVKDWIDVEGFPCAGTSHELADRRPSTDATAVARLRAAGAVVLAKTKAWNGVTGGPPVAHPQDGNRTPGGSSSGEAVVVAAAGVSVLGLGSDSGGSVRLPAAWCGVFGLKPTAGLVPTTGHFPRVGPASDGRTQLGLLAADLDPIDAALPVLAGPDFRDPGVSPVPWIPSARYSLGGRSFAVLPVDAGVPVIPEVAAAVERAADRLAAHGMERVAWTWDWLSDALEVTQGYWDRTQLTGAEVATQLWDWDRFRRRALTTMEAVDVLVGPTVADVAPEHRPIETADFVFTLPASLTGGPAISVPSGVDARGLPLAVQLIGRPWEDGLVLAAARALG